MGDVVLFLPRVLRGYPTLAEGLDPAEAALLLGLRWWVVDLQAAADPLPRLRQSLDACGAAEAAFPLDLLMRAIARTARRSIEVACPRCPQVTADEHCLLHATRLAQGGATRQAEDTLRASMISPEGASFALTPLEGIGAAFAAAGLLLRPRALVAALAPADEPGPAWRTPPG